jgi:hypothetical protein
MADNKKKIRLVFGILYFLYSLAVFGVFSFLFALWSVKQEPLLYTLLQSDTMVDKVMLVDLHRFIMPAIQIGMLLSLMVNMGAFFFLMRKKAARFVGEFSNNIFLIYIAAIAMFGILNIENLIGPAKYSIPEFSTMILSVRIILGMIAVITTIATLFFNRLLINDADMKDSEKDVSDI